MKSGLLEIVPALGSRYDSLNEGDDRLKALLRRITTHIIDGDFKEWKYTHEKSEKQLEDLSDEQKKAWIENLESEQIEIEVTKEESQKREEELKTAQEIIKKAKGHILEARTDLDFSRTNLRELKLEIKDLTDKIKIEKDEKEKRRLIEKKRELELDAVLIEGVLEIEEATPESFSQDKILSQANMLREKIIKLSIPQADVDLEQIAKIFTVGEIKSVRAQETDDPISLLKVGTEPQETCQSWRQGGYNQCLLAYVVDSNKKLVNVFDDSGRIIFRSIMKLTSQKEIEDYEDKTKKPVLFVETPYTLSSDIEVYRAWIRLVLVKADSLGIQVNIEGNTNEEFIKMYKEEAKKHGYSMEEKDVEVFIPESLNKHEYADRLGGSIRYFNNYHRTKSIIFKKDKY